MKLLFIIIVFLFKFLFVSYFCINKIIMEIFFLLSFPLSPVSFSFFFCQKKIILRFFSIQVFPYLLLLFSLFCTNKIIMDICFLSSFPLSPASVICKDEQVHDWKFYGLNCQITRLSQTATPAFSVNTSIYFAPHQTQNPSQTGT